MSKYAMELAAKVLEKYHYYIIKKGVTDRELLDEGFTAFQALKSAIATDVVLNHSWTMNEKKPSDYVCIGHLDMPGIEDFEYMQCEIEPFNNVIESLQEKFINGTEGKKVPIVAYVGALNKK
jgi:hypothetical protein